MKSTNLRILILALVLLLAVPSMANAELASVTLQISDPVLTTTDATEDVVYDLTGVALQLGTAWDVPTGQALLSLSLLTEGVSTASAFLGLDSTQLYALATGISQVLTLPLDDAQALIESSIDESIPMDFLTSGDADQFDFDPSSFLTQYTDVLSELEIVAGPEETITINDETVQAARNSVHINNEQLRALLGTTVQDIPDSATVDAAFFLTDSGLRVEGTVNNIVEDDDDPNLDFGTELTLADEGATGKAWAGNDDGEVTAAFEVAPSADHPDYTTFNFVGLATELGENADNELAPRLDITYGPVATEGGLINSVLTATAYLGDMSMGEIVITHRTDETDEYYALQVTAEGDTVDVSYTGTIEPTETGVCHAGTVEAQVSDDSGTFNGGIRFNTTLNLDETAEGKFVDISGMEQILVTEITEDQQSALMDELNQLGITVLGQLMTVPSVSQLIASMM